jgi:hypothetical protein
MGSAKMAIDSLVRGEVLRAEYELQLARRSASGWAMTIPPLRGAITNYRLILWPQTRRPYPPASIPRQYILRWQPVQMEYRTCTMMKLKSGHVLYIVAPLDTEKQFYAHLTDMIIPPLDGEFYNDRIIMRDLRRLIALIEAL